MNIKKYLRPCGKITDIFIIATIFMVIMETIAQLIATILLKLVRFKDLMTAMSGSESIGEFLTMYMSPIGAWIVFLFVALVFKNNRPMIRTLAYNKNGNTVKGALIGLFAGFALNGFCILMSSILGDIKLYFNGFRPGILLAFLLTVAIQSGSEEVLCRCYLYQKLRRRYRNPAVAIIVNAVIFMALHLFNPGITFLGCAQIVLVGLAFSLIVYRFDCLWAAIMMHTGWNFTQSILFGLPNSGIVSEYSLFKLDAASAKTGLFYHVNFGVEGSAGACVLLAILCVILTIMAVKHGEKKDYWAEMEKEAIEKAEAEKKVEAEAEKKVEAEKSSAAETKAEEMAEAEAETEAAAEAEVKTEADSANVD